MKIAWFAGVTDGRRLSLWSGSISGGRRTDREHGLSLQFLQPGSRCYCGRVGDLPDASLCNPPWQSTELSFESVGDSSILLSLWYAAHLPTRRKALRD